MKPAPASPPSARSYYNYKRLAAHLNIPLHETHTNPGNLAGFPIEKARLQAVFPLLTIGNLAVIAFGWVLEFGVHLAVPTTLLFFIGGCMTAANSIVCTLLVDLYPANASAAAASRHFVRCLFGAGATALLQPMLDGMGRGWCFTLIALVTFANAPLLWVVIRCGPRWREQRAGRS
ncbi:uncharacterized protein BDW47DRAFT_122784 [Aspergillus candidus]|uniref:Major facilitator superfamily domain-containing protein n=1 Tax=Aspergillus candidus TaxID=41067 RepID=A0A2I2FKR8_ASPCN|nr:hypothetical protein BDW47DRAFT_122784 [Aspergillus candidus]PLB41219.1 hypothetical protein BDW47DRAFT_122784 [Aspergillus candidus]